MIDPPALLIQFDPELKIQVVEIRADTEETEAALKEIAFQMLEVHNNESAK